ncbi:MAG TPA: glycosyl transferase [Nitrososphaeraceae archaeon]|nr:glycosyl transferase [Nitrososphaeraceae archaeon]
MKGGVGRYTYHLVHALRDKKNIEIHVVAGGSQSKTRATSTTVTSKSSSLIVNNTSNSDTTSNYDTDNHDIDNNNKYVVHYDIIKKGDWKNSQRLFHLVQELKPDIVNIQYERGLYEVDTTVGHIIRRVIRGSTLDKFYKECPVPTVSTLHTVMPYNEYQEYIKERALRKEGRFSSLPLPIRAAIRRWVMKRRYDLLFEVVKMSVEIISPAKTIHEIVKRGTVIYHGAEPAVPLLSPREKYEFRKEFGLPNDKRLLLAFGYVGSYKGFDILDSISLPNGWSLVVKQNTHERGKEQPVHIKNAISLHLGYLDDETLSKLFFSCDAIIFPYKVVSISGVLFDALAHGLPFIASDMKFFREFAEIGLGITSNRIASSFSKSLSSLAADYDQYKENVQQFNPKLRWSNIAEKHIELYSRLISSPS